MRAFALAVEEGADGVELDVRLCATGEVVVVHDRTLTRTTHGASDAPVARLALRELRAADVGEGERVPLLDEVLDLLRTPATDRIVNVEVKWDDPDRIALSRAVIRTLLRRTAFERVRVLLSTFDPRIAAMLRAGIPGVPLGMLVDRHEDTIDPRLGQLVALALRARAIHPRHRLATEAAIRWWHRLGFQVNAWTPNHPDQWARLVAANVDGIITDDVRSARAYLTSSFGTR